MKLLFFRKDWSFLKDTANVTYVAMRCIFLILIYCNNWGCKDVVMDQVTYNKTKLIFSKNHPVYIFKMYLKMRKGDYGQ